MFVKILRKYSSESIKAHQKEIMARGLPKQKPIVGVNDIVLVSSGKGGVGKSTTAVNLSTVLKIVYPKKKIGLLDTDIFGPTIPLMMNLHETPILTKQNLMKPLINYGVKCMSFGFLIEEGSPVIWRGLLVMQALEKLMRQVDWGDIDILIVDTPPGTGDTHLSLIQNLPISGVILVTTPQKAALEVTKRGAAMYQKLNIPLIGLIENMSNVVCPSCSNNIKIFGSDTIIFAEKIGVNILESFPLNDRISIGGDKGVPVVLNTGSVEFDLYKNVAYKINNFLNNKHSHKISK
ncbi:hypothetical protein GWI33_018156 [Rhynchophorus ferrugineus]|uniref:Iron-sulfur protein NUBPL n=1 Tax=Rhynchophorus ferrugineus TaxID=354439 RepID=A0A834HVI4_RHYFE|nr:hypothetical protein GWI33_018156 [Rhynchophorus ferrugineus]